MTDNTEKRWGGRFRVVKVTSRNGAVIFKTEVRVIKGRFEAFGARYDTLDAACAELDRIWGESFKSEEVAAE